MAESLAVSALTTTECVANLPMALASVAKRATTNNLLGTMPQIFPNASPETPVNCWISHSRQTGVVKFNVVRREPPAKKAWVARAHINQSAPDCFAAINFIPSTIITRGFAQTEMLVRTRTFVWSTWNARTDVVENG